MDQLTLDRINLLHPKVRAEVRKAYEYVNNKLLGRFVRLRFSATYRTFMEQDAEYAKGRTVKGKIVTKAKGGFSIHNYGLAFDIVLLIDKDQNGTFETASWDTLADFDGDLIADWMEVVNYFKALGWTWGGDWETMYDPPHLEKTFGHTANELLNKYNASDYTTEVINGKKYNYPNL